MKIQINYVPRPWQTKFHKEMETKKRAILVLHRRAGKAQPLSAKVLTPSGFTTMGKIKKGDEILTPKGTIAKVAEVFPQPKQQIYKITLQDGSQTRATAEHLWKVSFANRRRKDGVYNTLYLKQFLERESNKTLKNKSRPLLDSVSPNLNFEHNKFEHNRKAIVAIEEDGVEPAQCILIDDPDHLYITDDFIVTHNTTAIVNQLQKDALITPESKYAYICPTYKQAKAVAWDIFKKYSQDIPNIKYNENELTIIYPNKSKIVLLGSDNTQSLRGIGLWGVAMDEYSQQPSNLWTEVILPTLADHDGYAIFLGTPMGKGEFYRIYQRALQDKNWYSALLDIYDTNLFTPEQIIGFQKEMSRDEFNQEFLCSFDSSTKGSYYSEEIFKARCENRIGSFPYNKLLPVHTVWDIGGYTSIGFFQYQDGKIFMIDYLSGDNMGIEYYVAQLKNKNYVYGKHFGPWDIIGKNFILGNRTVAEICFSLGIAFEMSGGKSVISGMSVQEGIKLVLNMFSRLYIDEQKCQFFLDDIVLYRREWDTDRGMWKDNPVHDYTSHAADMLRYAAQAEPYMEKRSDKLWHDYKPTYQKNKYQG